MRSPVPAGKVRICVAGFTLSHHTGRARKLADAIVKAQPSKYESWFYFDTKTYQKEFLPVLKAELPPDQQELFKTHKSSPFCWLEHADGTKDAKGGRDRLCEWAIKEFPSDDTIQKLCATQPSLVEAWVDEAPGTAASS